MGQNQTWHVPRRHCTGTYSTRYMHARDWSGSCVAIVHTVLGTCMLEIGVGRV